MHRTSVTTPHVSAGITKTPGSLSDSGAPARIQPPIGKLAVDIPMHTDAAQPAQVARIPAVLIASSADKSGKAKQPDPQPLRTDHVFDKAVMQKTRIYKDAICTYEDYAFPIFGRDRALWGKSAKANYLLFKNERTQALNSHKDSPTDVSKGNAYMTLSENRRKALISSFDPLAGDSPLEAHLPKNSAFRRLLEPELGSIRDIRSGLNAQLVRRDGKPDRYILTFPGTGVTNTGGAQWKTNIRQFLGIGGVPKMYRQALELAQELQSNLPPGCKLELCGHSMGGGIASYVGLALGVDAVGFNSAPLGPDCLKALRKANTLTPERVSRITHIRTKGDPATSRTVNALLTRLAHGDAGLGTKVPKLVGAVYQIDPESAFNTTGSTLQRHTMQGFNQAYS